MFGIPRYFGVKMFCGAGNPFNQILNLLRQILGKQIQTFKEIQRMSTGMAILTLDVQKLQTAVASLLQTQTTLITTLQNEHKALQDAIAAEDPEAVAAASTSIETVIAQLESATAAASEAIAAA